MACEKWSTHYELWKEWRKNFRGPWLHEVLVLLGLAKSPTFEYFKRSRCGCEYDEDVDELLEEIRRIYREE